MSHRSRWAVIGISIGMWGVGVGPVAAEFWNPFARDDGPANPETARGPSEPYPEHSTWPRWNGFSMLPKGAPSGPQESNLIEQWSGSTQRALRKTKDVIVAPFDAMGQRMSDFSLWPQRRSGGDASWSPSDSEPIGRPSTVPEFLALPRPQ